jgi:hypothetical protein
MFVQTEDRFFVHLWAEKTDTPTDQTPADNVPPRRKKNNGVVRVVLFGKRRGTRQESKAEEAQVYGQDRSCRLQLDRRTLLLLRREPGTDEESIGPVGNGPLDVSSQRGQGRPTRIGAGLLRLQPEQEQQEPRRFLPPNWQTDAVSSHRRGYGTHVSRPGGSTKLRGTWSACVSCVDGRLPLHYLGLADILSLSPCLFVVAVKIHTLGVGASTARCPDVCPFSND